ncbi:hypothetical protein AB1Y20_002271 [Prymnesium parvum]|uniref:Plastidal glycolate/glycerate translocator 1, chloroplastic n=1 Tax=Prymnesium parvum TaxID=97485 RepID=A0AB34J8H0_PRYPA
MSGILSLSRHPTASLAVVQGTCMGPPLHFSERYIELLRCGGSVLMLSRVTQHGCPTSDGWGAATLVREQRSDGSFTPPRVLLPCTIVTLGLRTAWGPAFACVTEGLLMAYGNGVMPGVVQHTVPLDGSAVGQPSVVLSPNWRVSNCFDATASRSTGACRFDSKMTVIAWRDSLWLFVRANIDMPGGRHVQVSRRRGVGCLCAISRPRMARSLCWLLLLYCQHASPLATVGNRVLASPHTPRRATRLSIHRAALALSATDPPPPAWKSSLTRRVQGVGSLGGIIAVDIALRRLFAAKAIPFPSSLAGMLFLFTSLCGLQATAPAIAQGIATAASPGCAIISKWLAIFFVPNLVILPLVVNFSPVDAARLASVIVCGLAASLSLAGLLGASILGDGGDSSSAPTAMSVAKPATGKGKSSYASPLVSLAPIAPWSAAAFTVGVLALAAHSMGSPIAASMTSLHFLLVTLGGFVAGGLLPASVKKVLHPLISATLLTTGAIAGFAAATSQPFMRVLRSYLIPGGAPFSAPGNLLLFMLGPATFSFGFGMFEKRLLIKQSARALSVVIAFSASFGLFVTAVAGRALQLAMPLRLAALSRQVTAPLAIAIAGMLGANPSLAASIVVITGLLAANFGQAILDALGVQSPVARGLAMGAAGHGIGTAAMAQEKAAFPFAAIAMALNAALSTVLVSIPVVRRLLLAAAGAPLT